MDSAPSMDTVLQALNVLYHQPEETGKEKASEFLSDMQKSVVFSIFYIFNPHSPTGPAVNSAEKFNNLCPWST